MTSPTFIIKEREYIDVYLELILVQMDIVRRDWVRQSFEMVTLEFFPCKDSLDNNASLGVARARGSKEVRNQSSARRCFECLILPFLIGTLGEAASRVL